ncbi:MAG: chromate transporter [Butyrivibrio sp.]|nr:chromate transporter [Butyrivibrio sp.]
MNLLLELFLTFAKIGMFTFGGGYAMISLIQDSCVEKKKWITQDEMMNITVIAESTPGPVAINFATYVGYRQKGLIGALVSTFGMVLPSFVIIYLISMFLSNFLEITWVARAFLGIKIAVGILIVDAAVKMMSHMKKNLWTRAIIVISFAAMIFTGISSVTLMLVFALLNLAVYVIFVEKKEVKK